MTSCPWRTTVSGLATTAALGSHTAHVAHHYWSGYFTSRQSLKKYLRVLTNVLNGARQLAMMADTDTCKTTTYTDKECTDNLEVGCPSATPLSLP